MIRISWTIDDGPSAFTDFLLKEFDRLKIYNITWFISRHQVLACNYYDVLFQLQNLGGEIAIHEIDPNQDSKNRFQRNELYFSSLDDALAAFKDFINELDSRGIVVKLVRLPGGELSEIVLYLKLLGATNSESFLLANRIMSYLPIKQEYLQVSEDYSKLQNCLTELNLKIWNGSKGALPLLGGKLSLCNSWQAECSGIAEGRGADNVTYVQAKARKKMGIKEYGQGIFERMVQSHLADGIDQSLIVLSHDTTILDIKKIIQDIKYILNYAKNKVDVRFCTLSTLFQEIRTN